jgi:hypothetical protein
MVNERLFRVDTAKTRHAGRRAAMVNLSRLASGGHLGIVSPLKGRCSAKFPTGSIIKAVSA